MIPKTALSIRQPWAWAIIHAGKDIENRSWQKTSHLQQGLPRRIAIHASAGMTMLEYANTAMFMEMDMGIICPPADQLQRGGIIGTVDIVDIVSDHQSKWFFGPKGLVLANPKPCDFIPARGALGFFKWQPAPDYIIQPAKWMLNQTGKAMPVSDLFNT